MACPSCMIVQRGHSGVDAFMIGVGLGALHLSTENVARMCCPRHAAELREGMAKVNEALTKRAG